MKKFVKVVMSGALVAALGCTMAAGFAACGNNSGSGDGAATEINIEGSTSMEEVMTALAEAFEEKYEEENSTNITINIAATGSGSGIQAATDGRVDFGMASRALSGEESKSLQSENVCLDGIAVIVNPACTLTSVTKTQLKNIYTVAGTTLGSVVAALRRESGSGTRDGFQEKIGIEDAELITSVGFDEFTSTGALKTEIANNKAATKIGYISMGSVDNSVKALAYDADTGTAVAATTENVKNGTYQLSRPFVICYKNYDSLSELTKQFIQFIRSTEGQEICEANGCISEKL